MFWTRFLEIIHNIKLSYRELFCFESCSFDSKINGLNLANGSISKALRLKCWPFMMGWRKIIFSDTFKVHLQHSGSTLIKSLWHERNKTVQTCHPHSLSIINSACAWKWHGSNYTDSRLSDKTSLICCSRWTVKLQKELKVQTNAYIEMITHIY